MVKLTEKDIFDLVNGKQPRKHSFSWQTMRFNFTFGGRRIQDKCGSYKGTLDEDIWLEELAGRKMQPCGTPVVTEINVA